MKLEFSKNDNGLMEAPFTGKLVSVSNNVLTFDNENQTEYRPATVNVQGKNIRSIVYEKSFTQGCIAGSDVQGSITYDPNDLSKDPFVSVFRVAETKLSLADCGVIVDKTTKATKNVKAESDVL